MMDEEYQVNPKDPPVISPTVLNRLVETKVRGRRRFVDPEAPQGSPKSYGPLLVDRSRRIWRGAEGGDIEGVALALGFNPALNSQFGQLTQSERWRTLDAFRERIARYQAATRIEEEVVVVKRGRKAQKKRVTETVDFGTPLFDGRGNPQFFKADELRKFRGWNERRGSLRFTSRLTPRSKPRTFEVFPGDARFALYDGQKVSRIVRTKGSPDVTETRLREVLASDASPNARSLTQLEVITSQRFIDAMLTLKEAPDKKFRAPKDIAPKGKIAQALVVLGYRHKNETNVVGQSTCKARYAVRGRSR